MTRSGPNDCGLKAAAQINTSPPFLIPFPAAFNPTRAAQDGVRNELKPSDGASPFPSQLRPE